VKEWIRGKRAWEEMGGSDGMGTKGGKGGCRTWHSIIYILYIYINIVYMYTYGT
jgi:hypothetical protein